MVTWRLRSRRKPTGGLLRPHRKKRRADRGRDFTATKVGEEEKRKVLRVRGGNKKVVLLQAAYANVKTDESVKRARIIRVVKNPANRQFARQNIITKGAIIETEMGLAKVTSRPSQVGVVNAVLLKE